MKRYENVNNVTLRINSGRWQAVHIADGLVLYKPRYMTLDVDWGDLDQIKRLRLPFLLAEYRGSLVRSIEATPGGVREVPIFYACVGGDLIVSDKPEECMSRNVTIDQSALSDFCFFGYVTGSRTLISDVFSLEAGSFLYFSDNAMTVHLQYRYNAKPVFAESKSDLLSRLDDVTESALNRVISGFRGRKVILPLSAGYDSRLLLCMMKKAGVEEVKCYAWGLPGSRDSEISRRLAEKLGYEWELVPYFADKWAALVRQFWITDMICDAASYVSISGLASLLFQERLRNRNNGDCVVLVGHTGDFIGGGHIPASISSVSSTREVASLIGKRHGLFHHYPKSVIRNVEEQLEALLPGAARYQQFEAWEQRERQAKFIVNTNRYYERLGLAWGMPLWDAEYVDFWEKVPYEFKLGSRLYQEYARDVFRSLGVDFGFKSGVRHALPGVDFAKREVHRLIRVIPIIRGWRKARSGEFDLRSGLSALESDVRVRCEPESCFVDVQINKLGYSLVTSPYEAHMRATLALLLNKLDLART